MRLVLILGAKAGKWWHNLFRFGSIETENLKGHEEQNTVLMSVSPTKLYVAVAYWYVPLLVVAAGIPVI